MKKLAKTCFSMKPLINFTKTCHPCVTESFSAFPPRSRHDSISSGVRILRHPSFCENDPNSRILQKRASLQLSVPPMIQGLGASTENMSTGTAYYRSNQNSRQSERITRPNSMNFQNSPSTGCFYEMSDSEVRSGLRYRIQR